MKIIHLALLDEQWLLWGEQREDEDESAPTRKGRASKAVKAAKAANPAHPFAMSVAQLKQALEALSLPCPAGRGASAAARAWLPSRGTTPMSHPLLGPPPPGQGALALQPWSVKALPVPPRLLLDLLCHIGDTARLAPGILAGHDLLYWSKVSRFCGGLVARQRFLPGMDRDPDGYKARWIAMLTDEDKERLDGLAACMPSVARALVGVEEADAPQTAPISLARRAMNQIVDRLIRATDSAPTGRTPKAFDSTHDQWLHALLADDDRMRGEEAELAALFEQCRAWQQPLTMGESSPFRLCLRLEEPKDGPRVRKADLDRWFLRFLLQPKSDPSLLVELPHLSKPRGRACRMINKHGGNPREFVLAALGQAAGLCPPIETGLQGALPTGVSLDTTSAYAFLTEHAMLLEQAGLGVMLPSWWTRTGAKVRLSAKATVRSSKMTSLSGMTLGEIAGVSWELALGDQSISLKDLHALARMKVPLVKVRGQWVEVRAQEIQNALEYWGKNAKQELTVRELLDLSLGHGDGEGGLPIESVEATGWIGELLERLDGRRELESLPAPDALQATLRPYQQRGYSWMAFLKQWGLGACLADDMGLGKTIQTLAVIQRMLDEGNSEPVLLVCPTSVLGNWQKEALRFAPNLSLMVHHGVGRAKGKTFARQAAGAHMVLTSYALLHRDRDLLNGVDWAGVVLDEAQNIKNAETLQSKAARSLRAGFKIALTGTPVENNVGDLWSIMEFLNPGLLGSQTAFRRKFLMPIQADRDPLAVERLKRLTGPFILRRLKTDKSIIADLPDKLEYKVYCTLTKEQAALYAAVLLDLGEALDASSGIKRKGAILAALSKMKQVCNHPAHFLGDQSAVPKRSGKLARLEEMLEELLEAGDRALVFSQFTEMGFILQRHLRDHLGLEIPFLHGSLTKRRRDEMVERFQGADGPRVMLLSLKAGGTGLNLTNANHVFHYDRWWNPAVENQATDRAFRIGQTRNVQVHKFVCAGTLEERIDEMIERKRAVGDSVLGTGEAWLTEMSDDALREVFALRAEAVRE